MHHILVDADQLSKQNITELAGLILTLRSNRKIDVNIIFILNDSQEPRIKALKNLRIYCIKHIVVPTFNQSADMALIAHLQHLITSSRLKKRSCSVSIVSNDKALIRMCKILAEPNLVPIHTLNPHCNHNQLRQHLAKAAL
ncbi:hypothetical protein ACP3V3_19835 [Vibrio sp. PNB22_3_1]